MGARIRRLRNAPIAEALVDLQVPSVEVPRDLRTALSHRLQQEFPIVAEMRHLQTRIDVSRPEPAVEAIAGPRGLSFASRDKLSIAQFRFDGFTFNRLRPYTSWEDLLAVALRLWNIYIDALSPSLITRIAVRYINRLALPQPLDLARYLTSPPAIPDGAPTTLHGFLQRLVLVDDPPGIKVILTQASEASAESGRAMVLLDVDVYRAGEFRVSTTTLNPILEELRKTKNQVFFASITEETARLYE